METLSETRRLAEVRELAICDTPPEAEYDAIAAVAAAVCRSPAAAVNFVDAGRHFTKAVVGMPEARGGSVPNRISFCAATIGEPDGVLVVTDTGAHERWRDNPLVTDGPRVGFYAGVSIVSRGQRVGVVCAFGQEPREVTDQERAGLLALAGQAATQLELRRHNAALRSLAVRDPLTGLANRTLLFDRLERALSEQDRAQGEVGVLFCDVDGFKRVNDRYGHDAGDRLLCAVAEHLVAAARESDTVARFAGDEFVVACPHLNGEADIRAVARRMTAAIDGRCSLPDGSPPPRISVGAVIAYDGEPPAHLLRRADAAMYAAKAAGRGQVAALVG